MRLHPRRRLVSGAWVVVGAWLASGCATTPAGILLPQGPGTPYSGHRDALTAAVSACRGVRTMEFLFSLRGRRGETAIRGRVRGAVARPGSLRLEGLAPFGAPRFVLAATSDAAMLALPRTRQVIRDAQPREMLYALAGLPLGPDDLRTVLTGCVVEDPLSVAAREYGNGWIAVELEGDAAVYLRPVDGALAVVAGTRGPLTVEYGEHVRGMPRRVRIRVDGAGTSPATDLTAELVQVRINTPLHPEAFVLRLPDDYTPVPLEELFGAAPLQDRSEAAEPAGSAS